MKPEKFSIKKRAKSFTYAMNGIKILISNEHNARIHLVFTILVILMGIFFNIPTLEWISISFAISLVFICEITNTAIEYIANFISPNYDEKIKKIKDLAAGAVLIAAINSVVVGLIIFVPKLKIFLELF